MRLRELIPLEEIFNNRHDDIEIKHKPYSDRGKKTGMTLANFQSGEGHKFRVSIHGETHSNVDFAKNNSYDLTHGTSLSHTAKVFSSVHHIIKQHLNQFPDNKGVTFSSKEPTRTKAYHHFAHTLSGSTKNKKNYESEEGPDGETYFTIHRKDMKL